jgi:thiopurine S-methyltransferase
VDLHWLRLDLRDKRGAMRVADADGVHSAELSGDAYGRVIAAAQPLFDWAHGRVPPSARTPRDSTLVAFEADALARSLRLCHLAERGQRAATGGVEPSLSVCDGDYDALHRLLREAARAAVREVRPRTPDPADPSGLTAESRWEYLYQNGGDGWELGRPAPPLARYLQASALLRRGGRALVIGCGRGNEALALARIAATVGAEVVAIDIAPTAVRLTSEAAAAAGLSSCLRAFQADFLDATDAEPLRSGSYDLILEHTCFCAIEPPRRAEYFAALQRLLRASAGADAGRLLGLFYCHDYPGGPPYGCTADEVRRGLRPAFHVEHEETPMDSVLTRAGLEWLVLARRTA